MRQRNAGGDDVQDQLLNGLNSCLAALLKKCSWPPALASNPQAKRNPHKRSRANADAPEGQSEAPLEDLQSPDMQQAGQGSWDGFDGAGPVVNPHTVHLVLSSELETLTDECPLCGILCCMLVCLFTVELLCACRLTIACVCNIKNLD